MDRQRIQVYTDPETKRRIELAAAKREMAVTAYCLEAIKRQLLEEAMLEEEQVEMPPSKPGESMIAELRALREAILAEREGIPLQVDIAALIERMRAGRDEQLVGLR